MPGTLLLAITRLLLDADTVARLVEPTIADLQREVALAGTSRPGRVIAHCRGYAAFIRIFLRAQLWHLVCQLRRPDFDLRSCLHHAPSVPLAVALLVFMWSMLTWGLVVLLAAALVFAVAVRRWNHRHPVSHAKPAAGGVELPALRINIALVPISANAGGLIFMLGSVAILMTGFPALAAFLAIAVAGGTVLAAVLFAWHASHPRRVSVDALGHLCAPSL